MLTASIDTLEGMDMSVVDIPGAYLSTDMDDEVQILFRGTPTPHYIDNSCRTRKYRNSYRYDYKRHCTDVLK